MIPIMALAVMLLTLTGQAAAEVQTEEVRYRDGDAELVGYLAWDDQYAGKRPGVLVVHEWWGLNTYVKRRARMLAELGYVAFALDMYGDGATTEHGDTASRWMQQITANIEQWRERAQRGLETLRDQPQVDRQRLAAIGYCFGGATVIQLAYAGVELDGVVSFHGSLPIPAAPQALRIRPSVLAFHGAADAFTPPERLQQFERALTEAGADWHLVVFGGARHGFTNPGADRLGVENLGYDAKADRRSWAHMRLFLDEIFER